MQFQAGNIISGSSETFVLEVETLTFFVILALSLEELVQRIIVELNMVHHLYFPISEDFFFFFFHFWLTHFMLCIG